VIPITDVSPTPNQVPWVVSLQKSIDDLAKAGRRRTFNDARYAGAVPEWTAERVVDGDQARALIARQFPELELAELRLIGEGWDNTVWLVDARWAFRFPRREIAIPGVRREMALLPMLAARLPLPVPAPAFRGRPGDGFPWPFFGAPYLPGHEPAPGAPGDAERIAHAPELAAFLRALHGIELDLGELLPVDPVRRADMAYRAPWAAERLRELARLGLWRAPGRLLALLEQAEALPPAEGQAIVHGDLHGRHLLVDAAGRPTGVIDWGDVCRADPAVDLMLLWSYVPPDGRAAFRAAYGPLTDDQLVRSRVLAVFLAATLALYGHEQGMPEVLGEALAGLDRAAVD
jgi:aminoglycoside phosphotransferase (APT) family kinase protein